MADLHGMESTLCGLRRREGDVLLEADAVNETILVEAHTNSVSIPSGLHAGAGDGDLAATRAGSVKERRTVAFETTGGACAGLDAGVWEAMVALSGRHFCPLAVGMGVSSFWRLCG